MAALFADATGCAADGLIAEGLHGAPRDAAAFAALADYVRPRLHAAVSEVVTWAEEILRGAHEVRLRLDTLRSPALAPAAADIRAQLDALITPGFLTAAGHSRLPALARYVKAAARRLDKLAENAGRDAQQMAVVHRRCPGRLPACAGGAALEARTSDAAAEIRWQVEELRVSLFAQTMGTPQPVSERRIMTAIDRLA